jgi:alpha-1,6-mannosyltransferase
LSATVAQPAGASGGLGRVGAKRIERFTPALAVVFTLVLLAATSEIVLDAAAGNSPLLPKSPSITHWMSGIGELLGFRVFLIALLVFSGAYAGMLLIARRLSSRWAIALVIALQAIVLVGPILISTDVYSYIAYARMGVLHGVNPYTHGPIAISGDPIFRYVGPDWTKASTAYGPLYTLISYPLALLGVPGAVWGAKLQALLASAGTLALTWRCAGLRGVDRRFALLAVGANPLYVIYCLGGVHNDLILIFFMVLGVTLALSADRRREALAGASLVVGALSKATGVVPLPFLIVSRRRAAPLLGAVAAVLLGLLAAYLAFGVHGADILSPLNRDAAFVSTDGFPTEVAHLLGKPGVYPIDHQILKALLVAIVVHLMWRTWRGYDWVAASGWTLLAICVTNAWLLAWYTLWCLPFAVISRNQDRRLLAAALAVQGLYVAHQISPILVPVS